MTVSQLQIDVEDYMLLCLEEFRVDQWTRTGLAERAAENFGHREWLEDETHWIWDLASQIYDDAYEKTFD